MAKVCENVENHLDYEHMILPRKKRNVRNTIAHSVASGANWLNASAIVASTLSGKIARRISTLRPKAVIIAACTKPEVARSLALNFGIYADVVPVLNSTDDIVDNGIEISKRILNLQTGDKIIITGGSPLGKSTNFLKIEEI